MNNNVNEQNNQGKSNAFSANNSGIFVNNASQAPNQTYMNNASQAPNQTYMNNVSQAPNQTYMNNVSQAPNQTYMNNNINQSINQPYNPPQANNNLTQNNVSNMNNLNYAPNSNDKNNKKAKKTIIILAIIAVIAVVGLILINILPKSSKTNIIDVPNAQKTLTCTTKVGSFGVYYDETYEYYINDGSVSLKQTKRIDLKKTQLDSDEEEWAQSHIDGLGSECNSTSGCKYDYNYSKGNYFETIIFYEEEILNESVQGLTAEEIYEKQKARHEGGKVDGLVYTCSGNGTTSTDTNNQNVYKTIDYNSYTGDSNSTEFDLLINKKVSFTNVRTFAGSFGSLTKNIICNNESSFTIEDNVEYTVTGIVDYNNGTYLVRLKDCIVTKE